MPRSCRRSRAATPIFRPSWSLKKLPPKCCANKPDAGAASPQAAPSDQCCTRRQPAAIGNTNVNMPVTDGDRDRGEAHRRIARMAAGGEIEFIAVPRANDMALLAELQAGAFLVRRDHFLDLVENLALTHRPAGMRAHVLVGEHFAAGAKDADLELVEG